MSETVIYEVNLTPRKAIAREFRPWLHDHVAHMLSLPGFLSARVLDQEEESAEDPDTLTVHYELEDRQALQTYLEQYAGDMRQIGINKFGDQFTATRRILFTERPRQITESPDDHCQNCGAYLAGQYCSGCGQRHQSQVISLWGLFRGLVGDLFELDSRLWRSLVPLVTRPGFLTTEYLGGKRVHYTPPLRMYLVLSILFFLVATFDLDFVQSLTKTVSTDDEIGLSVDTLEENAETALARREQCNDILFEGDLDTPMIRQLSRAICLKVAKDDGASFARELVDNIPTMLFIFLPLIALVMKSLYLGSKRYYVEHLLFFVHFHSAFFLMLTVIVLISRTLEWIPLHSLVLGLSIAAVAIYTPIYLFKAVGRVYGQHWSIRVIKFLILFVAYLICATITLSIGALATALL